MEVLQYKMPEELLEFILHDGVLVSSEDLRSLLCPKSQPQPRSESQEPFQLHPRTLRLVHACSASRAAKK
jgi:hypothetical protein